jgi:glycosyltransferase involved in cell wall biosynthesis
MEPKVSRCERLSILMGSGVPKRREGGVAAIIYNLGREIERLGHRVTYVFQEDLVLPGSVPQRFSELVFSARLARYIAGKRDQFSLVNLHGPVGFPYGIRRRILRSSAYPPFVMTLHGLEEWRVHAMSREAKKGRAWNFSFKNRVWHRLYHMPRFDWSIRTADGAHAVCRDVWAMLQLKYNMDPERVAYIPSGVEQRFFVCRRYQARETLRLLYVGTWLDQRGIFYIRDALKRVAPRVPGLKMTFAGCGVPAEEIEKFFGPELTDRIEIRPVVAADRMHEVYSEHDVFLFPSLMEAVPLVVQEAMASGMPVITTETCGMPDLIRHEVNGLLIPTANATAMEEAILQLAESVQIRQELGEAARETMKRYTWARAARQLEELYQRVLALDRERRSP